MLKQVFIYNQVSNEKLDTILTLIVKGAIISVENSKKNKSRELSAWLKHGQKKVTLKVQNNIMELCSKCKKNNLNYVILSTKGVDLSSKYEQQKEIETCILVIGPDYEKKINPLTLNLKLY